MARKSHIYVDASYYDKDAMGPVRGWGPNAAYAILSEAYDRGTLDDEATGKFEALNAASTKEGRRLRKWAREFKQAFDDGDPLPMLKFGGTVDVDTSAAMGDQDYTSMAKAYLAVLRSGRRGATSMEARMHGEKGGGISGALTKLHQHGVLKCLQRTR